MPRPPLPAFTWIHRWPRHAAGRVVCRCLPIHRWQSVDRVLAHMAISAVRQRHFDPRHLDFRGGPQRVQRHLAQLQAYVIGGTTAPSILTQPTAQSAPLGGTATFTVSRRRNPAHLPVAEEQRERHQRRALLRLHDEHAAGLDRRQQRRRQLPLRRDQLLRQRDLQRRRPDHRQPPSRRTSSKAAPADRTTPATARRGTWYDSGPAPRAPRPVAPRVSAIATARSPRIADTATFGSRPPRPATTRFSPPTATRTTAAARWCTRSPTPAAPRA